MKQLLLFIAILAVAAGIGFGGHVYTVRQRLETKVTHVKAEMEDWIEQGRDPGVAFALMQHMSLALKDSDLDEAERLLDKAQASLDVPANERPFPHAAPGEDPSDLYGNPKPVQITGYDGNAMEPFISPDGKYLFFNNENDPGAQTDLYFAERTGPYSFKYRGKLKGANSTALDAAPSLDRAGNFYFTSPRDYEASLKSIFTGKFDGADVTDVHAVDGPINPLTHGSINMDVCISPDGNTMYISRASFEQGFAGPKESDLMIAHLHDGKFQMDPHTDDILKNVNSAQLEYAPAISADGRELYFTRSQAPAEPLSGPQFRIMVAMRGSDSEAFGKPRALTAFTGFVEAPSISLDKSEMFVHKKVDGKWVIFRAVRKK